MPGAFVDDACSQVAAMKGPGFGVYRQDYYTDIAIATGATFIAKEVRNYIHPSRLFWDCTCLPVFSHYSLASPAGHKLVLLLLLLMHG